MRLLYSSLFYLAVPLLLGRLAWRSIKAPAYRQRWNERFGFYPGARQPGSIWFHAVSVGEAEAAFPLISAFARCHPDHLILVTTTTPTGSARVRSVLGDTVQHVYLPYDLPDAVARFLAHFRPSLAVIMETEIWPNLYRGCGSHGIPLAIVNARLSEKSARGYSRLPHFTRECLAPVGLIAAQSEADARRFLEIGARPEAVRVSGNIKFDVELASDWSAQAGAIRTRWFAGRPTVIAGSTHEGEETLLLDALAAIREHHPEVLLLLAPRHPERGAGIADLCRARGLSVTRRSSELPSSESDILLLDTLGELRLFYAASDIAFVGGSLVPRGGHNVLEPALAGVPVLFGPHTFNFTEASNKLEEAGGGLRVADSEQLASTVNRLLDEPERCAAMGTRARLFVEQGRGALRRVVDLLGELESGSAAPPAP